MTPNIVSNHIYHREIEQGIRTSLSVIANRIGEGATVLDLGTGTGALGKQLSIEQNCLVDGITYNAEEANFAKPYYRRLEIADLESCVLTDIFQTQRYDFIVCADVLEHIRNPERLTLACKELLAPGGHLVVSVPNLGYCGLIAELMNGEFLYRTEGLLDRTHVRFFTRRNLEYLFRECGLRASSIDVIDRPLIDSEFTVHFDSLPPNVARHLLALPDAMAYQFVSVAQPITGDTLALSPPSESSPEALVGEPFFACQIYLGNQEGYAEEQKLVGRGVIGKIRQTLHFEVPTSFVDFQRLRFDPADRIGYFYFYKISFLIGGRLVWNWQFDQIGAAQLGEVAHSQIVFNPPLAGAGNCLLFLTGPDPWIEIPIPQSILESVRGNESISIEAEVGWPMSADYLALSGSIEAVKAAITEQKDASDQEIAHYSRALQRLAEENSSQKNTLQEAIKREHTLQKTLTLQRIEASTSLEFERHLRMQSTISVEAFASTINEMRAAALLADTKMRSLLTEIKTLTDERSDALARLNWIENSRLFRLTRPLIRAKMRLNPLFNSVFRTQNSRESLPASTKPTFLVDIVIPVYKGLEDTQRCLNSVLGCHCLTPFRVIVINDASPDASVTQWLREIAEMDPRILLLENEQNLGFVATVNRGMSLSDSHDVVLLNSDTEVANDWLDRLKAAAYIDNTIGTVTPFSNNATICSYPVFCGENPMVADQTTASLDLLFANANAGQVVDIPTGVGFCMYIRRECLSSIGLFDVVNFGKGYGEENDFCRRAAKGGWRNLHALDTFVLHSGGVSFGSSKNARVDAAMQTMARLHPEYDRIVQDYLGVDPASKARLQVDLARIREFIKPAVLFIIHDRSGGTIRHVDELATHLAENGKFFTLRPIAGAGVNLRLMGKNEGFSLNFYLPNEFEDLILTLKYIKIRHIHFHHLIGHSDLITEIPDRLNIRFDFTIHDYYLYCPQISLTNLSGRYCGERSIEQCNKCLNDTPAPNKLSILEWREKHHKFLNQARFIFSPSVDAQKRFIIFLKNIDILAIPHTDLRDLSSLPTPIVYATDSKKPLRIAVIGALSAIKGADLLEDVALASFQNSSPLEFHLIGYAYRHLKTRPHSNLIVHGAYEEAKLSEILESIKPDIVWFTALWPETYSYTLSACLAFGFPVVAPDIGAFPERLAARAWSWVEPWEKSVEDWVRFFVEIREKHFLTATPPKRLSRKDSFNVASQWNYKQNYFDGISDISKNDTDHRLREVVERRLSAKAMRKFTPRLVLKNHTLKTVSYLRKTKAFSSIARTIPATWQGKVKTWLQS